MQDEFSPVDPARLVPASPAEVAEALVYALSHDERGKPRKSAGGWEFALGIAAEHLAGYLERAGFVVMRRTPGQPHST